jgi:hypothetical protein
MIYGAHGLGCGLGWGERLALGPLTLLNMALITLWLACLLVAAWALRHAGRDHAVLRGAGLAASGGDRRLGGVRWARRDGCARAAPCALSLAAGPACATFCGRGRRNASRGLRARVSIAMDWSQSCGLLLSQQRYSSW